MQQWRGAGRLGVAAICGAAGVLCLVAGAVGSTEALKAGAILLLTAGAWVVSRHPVLRSFSFTAWVLVCAGLALCYPQSFRTCGGYQLTALIVPLVQIIMFGMGTTLSPKDFSRVLLRPWPVMVGVTLQFAVMPLLGCAIARLFGFDGELAAGIILIGSVSGGAASNVMAYIAGANVALSVSMTAVSTLAAPLVTPALMRLLAGRYVPIDMLKMMIEIVNMIIVPVVSGLFAHVLLYSTRPVFSRKGTVVGVALAAVVAASAVLRFGVWLPALLAPLRSGVTLGFVLVACVAAAKGIVNIGLKQPNTWMDRVLPLVSMTGICLILLIVIAMTRDIFLEVGPLLVAAALTHNLAGYTLGYGCARLSGVILGKVGYRLGFCPSSESWIAEADCRTVAFEVGMQNGGMGAGLAVNVLHSSAAALPSNVFGTVMNVTGSVLANWWKRKPIISS